MIIIAPDEHHKLCGEAEGRTITLSLDPYGFVVTDSTEKWVLLSLLEQRRHDDTHNYLVSYYYRRHDERTGFASIVLTMHPVGKEDLDTIVEFITGLESLAKVVILNIVKLQ